MTERLTVALEDGVKAMLVELAGGERKIGAYLSKLVSDAYAVEKKHADLLPLQEHIEQVLERVEKVQRATHELQRDAVEKAALLRDGLESTHAFAAAWLNAYEQTPKENAPAEVLTALERMSTYAQETKTVLDAWTELERKSEQETQRDTQ